MASLSSVGAVEASKKPEKREVVIAMIPRIELEAPPLLAHTNSEKQKKSRNEKKVDTEPKKKKVPKKDPKTAKRTPQQVRTSDLQPSGIPDDTHLIGERNTIASSNAEVNPNAPDRAAIKGKESTFYEATNTSYQDGDLAHANKGGEPQEKVVEQAKKSIQSENTTSSDSQGEQKKETKSSVQETEKRGEFVKQEKASQKSVFEQERKDYLETSNALLEKPKIAVADQKGKKSAKPLDDGERSSEKNTIENETVSKDALKQKAEKKKKVKQQESEPKVPKAKSSKQGFRSEAKATRFEGSISRRSKVGSSNVKATPLGKYRAKVSKIVEREWQRRCSIKGDLIQPGTLRMSFLLNARGKVEQVRTISQSYGSEMNRSITFQAINSAKLPPMPAKVRKLQNGDPMEFTYTFSF